MVNLEALYDEVLKEYYQNAKYKIPTISWSKEFMLARFGEYQAWENRLEISRALNTDSISQMAIKSVIYHELLHLDIGDHNKKFRKLESKFPDFKKYQQELEEYLYTINQPELKEPHEVISNSNEVYFGLLPDADNVSNNFCYFNHFLYVETDGEIKDLYITINSDKCLVIWIVNSENRFYLAGWSKNCQISQKEQQMQFKKFGYCDFCFQVKTKTEDNFLIPVLNQREIPSEEVPKALTKNGLISAHEFEPACVDAIINYINLYPNEFENVGILDDSLEAVMPYLENDVGKIIEKSLEETLAYRYLWYANLAVCKEVSYCTLFNKARALFYTGAMDEAYNSLKKAMEFEPEELSAKSLFVKTCCILGTYDEAKKQLNDLDVLKMKDKELVACSKFLANNVY